MKKLFTLCLLVFSLSASAQWQQTGSKVRYVNGLGIPTRDTAAGVAADSSQILIRPADSSLYVKYKRTWLRVGGTGFTGSGTIGFLPRFTSSTSLGISNIYESGGQISMFTTSFSPGESLTILGSLSQIQPISLVENTVKGTTMMFTTLTDVSNIGTKSNHLLGLITNNTIRAAITPGGQFNIGGNYASTNNTLQVTGNAAIGYTAAAPTNGLIVNGSVGVGTTSPGSAYRLTLNGDASTNTGGIAIRQNGTDVMYIGNIAGNNTTDFEFWNPRNGYTRFGTNNTERLRIDNNGFLGLGVTPSTWTLGKAFEIGNVGNGIWNYGVSNTNIVTNTIWNLGHKYASNGAATMYAQNNGMHEWLIAASGTAGNTIPFVQAMTLNNSGRVLINTTTDNGVDQLQVNGSIQGTGFNQAYTARTTTYTATTSDYFIDCTSGTFTVNLFTAVGNTGRIIIVKNSGTGTITVDPNGSQTIDGAATQTLSTQWSRVHIISDGANWKIISN